jgi:glycerol uptake facilitator protein
MASHEQEQGAETETSTVDQAPLARRLGAEFAGTLLLVAVGTGAATVSAQRVPRALEAIGAAAGSPEAGSAQLLIENTFADLLPVAIAFAAVLAVVIYAFGGVSGGHFNPAVTLALSLTRRVPFAEVLPYLAAQCVGAIAGAMIVAGIYGQDGAAIGGTDIFFGAPVLGQGVGFLDGVLAETLVTFVLMSAIMAIAVDWRAPKGWSGLIVGLSLAGGILVTGAATGGSANFARSLGPLVASLFFNTGGVPWDQLGVYIIGPILGAVAAAFLYDGLTGLELAAPAPGPGAATPTDSDVAEPTGGNVTERRE